MSRKNRICRLFGFLVPFAAMLFCFMLNGMAPFGEFSIFAGDAGAQYYPFLMMLRDTVREGGSLLYTWKTGLGMSFVPIIAYYVSSPLNLLCILVPDQFVTLYLLLAVCFRYGFAGWSFTVLAQTVKPKLTVAAPVFGWMFALCGWMLTSYWQLIWLDTVALTPLVLAGLIKAVRDRDYRLYPAALGLSLVCNFYMGFLTCMLTGFCWIGLLIILKKPLREVPKEAGRFLGLSVLSAAFGAVLFIPVIMIMFSAARASNGTVSFTLFYESLPELLGQLASLTFPIINNHPPNLQSSVLVLMLPLLFLMQKRISLRERVFCTAMAGFLLVSLWYEPLNIMWHGFHFPGGTVDRFAYMVPLVLAYIGWRYTESLTEEAVPLRKQVMPVLLMLPLPVLVLICAAAAEATDIPLVSAVYCLLYFGMYVFRMYKPERRFWFGFGLSLMVGLEVGLNTYSVTMRKTGSSASTHIHESVTASAETVRGMLRENEIARTGFATKNYHGNKELLYGLPFGSSSFNSLNSSDLQDLCTQMGYRYGAIELDDGSCYYEYDLLSPFAAQLFDIQYVISENSVPGYHCITNPERGETLPEWKDIDDDTSDVKTEVYESDYPTYPGFCIAQDVQPDGANAYQLMDVQNSLFAELTGSEKPLAECFTPEITEYSDVAVTQNGKLTHVESVKMTDENNPPHAHITYHHSAEKSGIWYAAVHYQLDFDHNDEMHNGLVRVTGKVDGRLCMKHDYGMNVPVQRIMHTLGHVDAGQDIELKTGFFTDTVTEYCIELYCFDEDVFREGYEKLVQNPFTVTDFAQSSLTGTVDADADSLLYLSIPYDRGWKAAVDGEPAEITPALGAMTGIPVTKGRHTVTLRFFPRGLIAGTAVSVIALTAYAVLLIMQTRQRKREQSKEKA